jgi:hypothetical protein
MSQFPRVPCLLLALLAPLLVPAPAAAASISLRYDFEAVITSTAYEHWCFADADVDCDDFAVTTYQGPPLSTRGSGFLEARFDTADPTGPEQAVTYDVSFLPLSPGAPWITAYDPAERTLSVRAFNFSDLFELTLGPDGGSGLLNYEQDLSGVDFAEIGFRLVDVTVTDPAELAPIPLPAGLPLLLAGIAGLTALGRRRT